MTSEATAKLISASGLAATELTPFAASAAIGDAASLLKRIRSLEGVPALAEFARSAGGAVAGSPSPSKAEYAARSIENLQVAATVLLRHLHCADSLQSIGSEHAVWVRLPTRLPLAGFADLVTRIQSALDAMADLAHTGSKATLEAADTGPLWIKVGLGSVLACEMTAFAVQMAQSLVDRRQSMKETGQPDILEVEAVASEGAARILSGRAGRTSQQADAPRAAKVVVHLVHLIDNGVEIRSTL